jgi:hypothetical protein
MFYYLNSWHIHLSSDCINQMDLYRKSSWIDILYLIQYEPTYLQRGHRGRDHMVVGFTTTYAISAYHHWCCEFESRSWRGLFDKTLCYKVCQWLATGRWFSPVSSTNKTDRHDITEIVLKEALNTIKQTNKQTNIYTDSYVINLKKVL